ncbi:MAG: hypothetical protein GXP53_12185 [Deltaproteobacteria bacterium]|nr:hypothetical protein [Deltaproteobacteria bacterium]
MADGTRENRPFDKKILQEIEDNLDPADPSKCPMGIEILGYGEISTVFGLPSVAGRSWACKRLPIFTSEKEAQDYIELYKKYNLKLSECGINVPQFDGVSVIGHGGIYVDYLLQERLDEASVCHNVIHGVSEDHAVFMLERIVCEAAGVWRFNKKKTGMALGLDGQLSNWAVKDFNHENFKIDPDTKFYFIDTSTPFIRKNGMEQINGRLLLKSAPKILQSLLAWIFLKDIIGRYYNFRDVIIDLFANLHKEQLPDLIDPGIDRINHLLENGLSEFKIKPVLRSEIDKYYNEDKFIWALYLGVRRFDRYVKTRILRRRYEFILPGKIKR